MSITAGYIQGLETQAHTTWYSSPPPSFLPSFPCFTGSYSRSHHAQPPGVPGGKQKGIRKHATHVCSGMLQPFSPGGMAWHEECEG